MLQQDSLLNKIPESPKEYAPLALIGQNTQKTENQIVALEN